LVRSASLMASPYWSRTTAAHETRGAVEVILESWRFSALLLLAGFALSSFYSAEYAVPTSRGSTTMENCGAIAPAYTTWRLAPSTDGTTLAPRLFHLYRSQPNCEEARRAVLGSIGVSVGVVLFALFGSVVRHQLIRFIVGLILLGTAVWAVGSAIVDGPIVANASLSAAAVIGILLLTRHVEWLPPITRANNNATLEGCAVIERSETSLRRLGWAEAALPQWFPRRAGPRPRRPGRHRARTASCERS